MSKNHANISIFVPHIGCPNMCSFCNQRHITGTATIPTEEDICKAVLTATESKGYDPNNTEIAFFGGSFTAIEREYMLSLLKTAYFFVESGVVKGIRISTRPDAIDREILNILKKYGVTAIELGAQSLDDNVLRLNDRGHTAQDVEKSSLLIKEYSFSLGLQMMTGLYGDTNTGAMRTLQKIISLKPDTLRIYPTIVLKHTHLCELYESGEYRPQDIKDAVELCADLIKKLKETDIRLIRLGLHSIDESFFVDGPWHPSFSELCYSQMYLEYVKEKITESGKYILHVSPRDVSKMIGQRRSNIRRLRMFGADCTVVGDNFDQNNPIIIERSDN